MAESAAQIGGAWLSALTTRRVMDALDAASGSTRFVGGCVRNSLLGVPVDDIDIATVYPPDEVVRRLRRRRIRVVPTGIDHGTVTAVTGGQGFEITTLRSDVTTDGRRATVAFTTDWAEDAARRDFTMNALYADLDGRVLAPVGGIEDAIRGRVKFVGDPATRIREDYLRILRFFRFHAWYGKGAPDAKGLTAVAAHVDGLEHLSAERIGKEIIKLLGAPAPERSVAAMAKAGVLPKVLPVTDSLDVFDRLCQVERVTGSQPGPMRRLVALTGGAVAGLKQRLRLSNAQARHLQDIAEGAPRIRCDFDARAGRAVAYRLGRAVWRDAVLLAWACAGAPASDRRWRTLQRLSGWDPPTLPVSGRDLLAIGIASGPALGEALTLVESRWIDSDFTLDRAQLLELAAAQPRALRSR